MMGTHTVRTRRRGLRLLAGAVAFLAVAPGGAAAATLENAFSCPLPGSKLGPATLRVEAPIPASLTSGEATEPTPVKISLEFPELEFGRLTVNGRLAIGLTIRGPGTTQQETLEGQFSSVVAGRDGVPTVSTRVFSTTTTLRPFAFIGSGRGQVDVDSLEFGSLMGSDPIDGLGTIFSGYTGGTCTREPDQDRTLALIDVTDQPIPQPTVPDYTLTGAATLKTLTKGSVPLKGGLSGTSLDASTGAFAADLSLEKSSAKLVALGFLPLTADVAFVPTEKVSGTLKAGKLVVTTKVRIKLSNVRSGSIVFVAGANCQTKQVSSITLRSTQPTFEPFAGGPLAGTFSISNLAGCGPLTGLLSSLTAGTGNAILVNATPKA